MCLLVVCNPNSTPSKDDLKMGACKNPHGFGFAIDTGDGIISERSMSAKKSIARFLELREQYPNGYAMWHARYATHGVKNELNCHPFKVKGEEYDTYLAHNGVLDIHIPKGDKRSDTRIMAEELLPQLGGVSALDNDYVYDMISAWSRGSKIAVMTNDPSAQYKIYIINENAGSWDDNGIWWSNTSYKPVVSTPRTESYTYTYGDEPSVYDIVVGQERNGFEDNTFECPNCNALVDLYESELYCVMCECCFDCSAQFLDCLCYNPSTKSMIRDEYGFLSEKWYSKEPLDF
jgi:glutamine amidotransferase